MSTKICSSDYSGLNADEILRNLMEDAASNYSHTTVIIGADGPGENGIWNIKETISVPSNTTVRLEGCTIKADKNMRVPMLVNSDYENGNENIFILGDGAAKFDGAARDGGPMRAGHNGLYFYNVENITLDGFQIGSTSGWGLTTTRVKNIRIENLQFFQDATHPWQDGVHVVGPAFGVIIRGITGDFGDDVIAIDTSLSHVGDGGAIKGVVVSDVVATNVHAAALIRTIASKDRPLKDVTFSNMCLYNTGVGGSDAAIKIGWEGKIKRDDWKLPSPEEHCNITLENITIENWRGAACHLMSPVKNLTIKNVVAQHGGPFFYNLEHEIDGLTIENCKSTLIGEKADEIVPDFYRALVGGKVYEMCCEYKGDFLTDLPGVISFDQSKIKDVVIRNTVLTNEVKEKTAEYPKALRVYETADVTGMVIDGLTMNGFAKNISFDGGEPEDLQLRAIREI
ncbi:MAG: hypothetical protein PF692_05020 [Kiritimatiellae bacterium]|jgi:hypothetical protein|nr:hypothetical protein [Kiritimatiellia bacterium]